MPHDIDDLNPYRAPLASMTPDASESVGTETVRAAFPLAYHRRHDSLPVRRLVGPHRPVEHDPHGAFGSPSSFAAARSCGSPGLPP